MLKESCFDTDYGHKDIDGNGCDFYTESPFICGNGHLLDDDDFNSNKMCCVCDGGTTGTTF